MARFAFRFIGAEGARIAFLGAALLGAAVRAEAGTTGTISGRVLEGGTKPVDSAQVSIVGQRMGAYTDESGRYTILAVPPGTYEVFVGRIGFETKRVAGVFVSADRTTNLDISLGGEAIKIAEVVVTAKRPPVDLGLTSTQATVSREEIESLPVQELDDIVNLQAGVVEGHFRGGRIGEVQYQVDGVSVNNAFDNTSILSVDRSLLQEVQVISGTFDAEYGQAMSGVVNAVLRNGSDTFEWSTEAYLGDFVFPGADARIQEDGFDPTAVSSLQFSTSGPLPISNTTGLASLRRSVTDSFVTGIRRFAPTDSSDFENKIARPTGDGKELPLGSERVWSGLIKISNTTLAESKIGYQAIFNDVDAYGANHSFRLNPDGQAKRSSFSFSHGFDWTQTFGLKTFLDTSVRQNYYESKVGTYDDLFDPRYDEAGGPLGDPSYEIGAFIQGVDLFRFRQKTNDVLVKTSLVSQINAIHQVKVGGEFSAPKVTFGRDGWLEYATVDGVQRLVRHVDDPPDFPGPRSYRPFIGALFAQDNMEWSDLKVRAGLRFDSFDARSTVPSDLANPANAIEDNPQSVPVPTSTKLALSPRLGLAYSLEDWAAIHFAYGHFRQFPSIEDMLSNSDYSILRNLQSGGVDYGVLGNPDVKPEITVQYEAGYKHIVDENLGLDVTIFFKDVRDLLGVEFISTYNGAEYARLTNVDFGNIFGTTFALDHRALGPVSVSLDYTWQQALGNASDPRETATRASAGEDPRPRYIPFNWDQRHTFNLTVSTAQPGTYSASAILRVASGQPYTPLLEAGFGQGLDANSGRKPLGTLVDLRAERNLGARWGAEVSLFGRAFNLFDSRFFNNGVFASTGSADYSRFPEADRSLLADPGRFYSPRRIEIGLRIASKGKA